MSLLNLASILVLVSKIVAFLSYGRNNKGTGLL